MALVGLGASHIERLVSRIHGDGISATGFARRRDLDIRRATNKIGERRRSHVIGRTIVFGRRLNLTHVGDASAGIGIVTVLDEVRDGDGGEDADDRDHDHDFDERKALSLFHFVCSLLGVNVNCCDFRFFRTVPPMAAPLAKYLALPVPTRQQIFKKFLKILAEEFSSFHSFRCNTTCYFFTGKITAKKHYQKVIFRKRTEPPLSKLSQN